MPERRKNSPSAWLPYFAVAIALAGWLVQYGREQSAHKLLELTVKRHEALLQVVDEINYSEHPQYAAVILAAHKE